MRILLMTVTLGAVLAAALPAAAQVYPDRVRSVTRGGHAVTRVERYQGNRQRETRTERVEKTVRVRDNADLVISNIAGDIVITRGRGNEIAIEAVKTGRGRTADEAQQTLQLLQVEIVERGNRVEVRGRYPDSGNTRGRRSFSGNIAFTIAAPERIRLTANSISGDISVRDITGELSLETISGDVRVGGAGRLTKAKTASGDVEIADTTIEGALDSGTISGNVVLRNVQARALDVGSVSGDVILENVESERIDAQSMSGNIRLSGPLTRGGRYDLGSHSGDIRIAVSGGAGFEVEASSFSGTIRSDLNLKSMITEGRARRRGLQGVYGDGSAFLDLSTFSGNIVIGR